MSLITGPFLRPPLLLLAVATAAPAAGEAEFLQALRAATPRLQDRYLKNVRVEEAFVLVTDGVPSPPRHHVYRGGTDAYLHRGWTDGATQGFVERIVVNRPDGRFILGKRLAGEHVLGANTAPKDPLESIDMTFYQTFPFYSVWTRGPVADFLAHRSTAFQIVGRPPGEVEVEVTKTPGDGKGPFVLSPMRITFDDQTYAVKAIRGRRPDGGKFVAVECDYRDGFPRLVTVKYGPSPEALQTTRTNEFTVYRTEPADADVFGLEQYGIPEPNPGYQKRKWAVPRAVWFGGAAALAAGVYFVARRRLARG